MIKPKFEYGPFEQPPMGGGDDIPVDAGPPNYYEELVESMKKYATTVRSSQKDRKLKTEHFGSPLAREPGASYYVDAYISARPAAQRLNDEGIFVCTWGISRARDILLTPSLLVAHAIRMYAVQVGIQRPYYFVVNIPDSARAGQFHRDFVKAYISCKPRRGRNRMLNTLNDIERVYSSKDAAPSQFQSQPLILRIGDDPETYFQSAPKTDEYRAPASVTQGALVRELHKEPVSPAEQWWNTPDEIDCNPETYDELHKWFFDTYHTFANMPFDNEGRFESVHIFGMRAGGRRKEDPESYVDETLSVRKGGIMLITRGGNSDRRKKLITSAEDINAYYAENARSKKIMAIIHANATEEQRRIVTLIQRDICWALRFVPESALEDTVKATLLSYRDRTSPLNAALPLVQIMP